MRPQNWLACKNGGRRKFCPVTRRMGILDTGVPKMLNQRKMISFFNHSANFAGIVPKVMKPIGRKRALPESVAKKTGASKKLLF
jgi:hypothetical protein